MLLYDTRYRNVTCNTNIYRNTAIHMPPEHRTAKIAQCVSYVIVLLNVFAGRYYYTKPFTVIEIIIRGLAATRFLK